MNRSVLFATIASFAAVGCDKKTSAPDPSHSHGSSTHQHAAAPADAPATAVTPAPTGTIRAVMHPIGELAPGKPGSLTLDLEDAAKARVTAFDTVHDKLLHLIVVAPDLSFFAHAHPEARPDGTFTVELTLPQPATYVAFADFKPTGGPPTIASTVTPSAPVRIIERCSPKSVFLSFRSATVPVMTTSVPCATFTPYLFLAATASLANSVASATAVTFVAGLASSSVKEHWSRMMARALTDTT